MPYIPKQYDSAKNFYHSYTNLGNISDALDNARLKAYSLYDDFYYNRPETFKVTLRGDSDVEIYLPSTKKIINSTARFLAVEFAYAITGGDAEQCKVLMDKLFEREEIPKKFIKGKRSMLTRGDQCWYITADNKKPAGERISLGTIHPSSVFRIEDPQNAFRVTGYHIVDIVADPRDATLQTKRKAARRQTFRKVNGRITTECYVFEIGAWDDRVLSRDQLKPIARLWDAFELPAQITQLPVYLVPNDEPDGSSWGLSQVAGIEYLINALNQSMTYEDLSLVLQGLGVYVTTAAPPLDNATGKPQKYKLHPGNVVEMSQGDTFQRVTGVASVAPFQDHIKMMDEWMMAGSGLPDMATGTVDVATAQSGIALALKMGPILAENQDKELAIGGRWDQLGYDLCNMWFPAFEGVNATGTTKFKSQFGDPMPKDRDAFIQETINLFTADLITYEEVRVRLETVGYDTLSNAEEKLLEQASKKAIAASGDGYMAEFGETSPDLINALDAGVGTTDQTGTETP